MKTHELKIKKEYADFVLNGIKTFEIRKNDRDYQVGDLVKFKVIDGDLEMPDVYLITYVLKGVPQYGLSDDYVVFSIKKI